MSVYIDISVFTEHEAVGRVYGDISFPIVPQAGDVVNFDPQGVDVVRHRAALQMDLITVTRRMISSGAEGSIILMLSDITAETKEDALQIIAFFEDRHGLFGDRWDEQDKGKE